MANASGIEELILLLRHRIVRNEKAGLKQVNIGLIDLGRLLDHAALAAPDSETKLAGLERRVAHLELLISTSAAINPPRPPVRRSAHQEAVP